MAESLNNSAQSANKSTKQTSKLTAEEALQIMGDLLKKYQGLGGKVIIMPEFYYSGSKNCVIILEGVTIVNGTFTRGVPEKK
jgi:hypothetical protein